MLAIASAVNRQQAPRAKYLKTRPIALFKGGMDTRGKRLLAVRTELGWSQRDVAAKADLDPSVIARVENDKTKRPEFTTVEKIAAALGVSNTWFQTGNGPREREPEQVVVLDDPDENFGAATKVFLLRHGQSAEAKAVVDRLRTQPMNRRSGKPLVDRWLDWLEDELGLFGAEDVADVGRMSTRDDGGGPRKVR
jgi:transcriptional regulator with XRE-family HTH domain